MGRRTLYSRDAHGNLIEIIRPDGRKIRWGYDENHHLKSIIDAAGRKHQRRYDPNGNLAAEISPPAPSPNTATAPKAILCP